MTPFAPSSIHYQTTWDALASAQRVLCVIPKVPDADNVASALALFAGLRAEGKTVAVTSFGPLTPLFRLFPFGEHIVPSETLSARAWDLVIVTDVSDRAYAGIDPFFTTLPSRPLLCNIDHHATNTMFGDVNLVLPHAASATTVVAHLFRFAGITMTPDIATCLLAGLLTDTGFFVNPATNDEALSLAGFLLERGARFRLLFQQFVRNKELAVLKVWGKAFERLRFHATRGLAVTALFHHELTAPGMHPEAAEGIANFLNILSGVRAVCIVREEAPGQLKASLRTTHPDVDVARLALLFGGGGHKKAAGFSMHGKLSEKNGRWEVEM